MSRVTITKLRDLVRGLVYSVSRHAAEELEDDTLAGEDAECVVKIGPTGRLLVVTVYLD